MCYAAYNLKLEQNVLVESFLPSSNPHPDLSTIKRQLDFDRSEQPESGNSIFDSSKERLDGRDKKDDVSHVSRPFSSHSKLTQSTCYFLLSNCSSNLQTLCQIKQR